MKIFFIFFTLFLVGCSSTAYISSSENFSMSNSQAVAAGAEVIEIVNGVVIPENIVVSEGAELYIYNRMSESQRVNVCGYSDTIPGNSYIVISAEKSGSFELHGFPMAQIIVE